MAGLVTNAETERLLGAPVPLKTSRTASTARSSDRSDASEDELRRAASNVAASGVASGLDAAITFFYSTLEVGAEAITSIVPGCADEEEEKDRLPGTAELLAESVDECFVVTVMSPKEEIEVPRSSTVDYRVISPKEEEEEVEVKAKSPLENAVIKAEARHSDAGRVTKTSDDAEAQNEDEEANQGVEVVQQGQHAEVQDEDEEEANQGVEVVQQGREGEEAARSGCGIGGCLILPWSCDDENKADENDDADNSICAPGSRDADEMTPTIKDECDMTPKKSNAKGDKFEERASQDEAIKEEDGKAPLIKRRLPSMRLPPRFNLPSVGSADASKEKYHRALLSKAALLNAEVETRRAELELKRIEFEHTELERRMRNGSSIGNRNVTLSYGDDGSALSSLCDSSASSSTASSEESSEEGCSRALAKRGTEDSDTLSGVFGAIARFAF